MKICSRITVFLIVLTVLGNLVFNVHAEYYQSEIQASSDAAQHRLVAGQETSFFIDSNNILWSFGKNDEGQLGDGTRTNRNKPVRIMDGVNSVYNYTTMTFAIKLDGTLWAWGFNGLSFGDGTHYESSGPIKIAEDVLDVSLGETYGMVLKSNGDLYSWGANNYGQLGNGSITSTNVMEIILSDVSSIASGRAHSLAIKKDGSLWAWGDNQSGQLGDGNTVSVQTPKKILDQVKKVEAGNDFTAIIKDDNSLWTWGENQYGQLGNGNNIDSNLPIKIQNNVVDVSLGESSSYSLTQDNKLWSWGNNDYSQLGNNSRTSSNTPTMICTDIIRFDAGNTHVLVQKSNLDIMSWGNVSSGQLGNGISFSSRKMIHLFSEVKDLQLDSFSLLLKSDNTLWSWGYNDDKHSLGYQTSEKMTALPVKILDDVSSIQAHYFAVKTDNTLWRWGFSVTDSTPVKVMDNVRSIIYFFYEQYYIVKTDNTLWKVVGGRFHEATQIMSDVKMVAAGMYHLLVLKNDGTLLGIGENGQGQLGNGNTRFQSDFVVILTGVEKVTAGNYESFALKADGTLWSWGGNNAGLGSSVTLSPVKLFDHIRDISSSTQHSLALGTNGDVWSWGVNWQGELGREDAALFQYKPIYIGNFQGVSKIVTDSVNSAIILNDGTVYACGDNRSNQLGLWKFSVMNPNVVIEGGIIYNNADLKTVRVEIDSSTTILNIPVGAYSNILYYKQDINAKFEIIYQDINNNGEIDIYNNIKATQPGTALIRVTNQDGTILYNQIKINFYEGAKINGITNYSKFNHGVEIRALNYLTLTVDGSSMVTNYIDSDGIHLIEMKDQYGLEYSVLFIIDKTPPIIEVVMSDYNPTTDNVIVSATTNEGTLNVSQYTFTENGEFEFVAIDDCGNKTIKRVIITTIDRVPPAISGVDNNGIYNTSREIAFIEGVVTLDGQTISSGDVVSNEGKHEIIAIDDLGNKVVISFTLDYTPPTIEISNYDLNPTNNDILVTAFTSDGVLNQVAHLFTQNGSFEFVAKDTAGNETKILVTISNIDKEAPTITGVKASEFYNNDRTITFTEGNVTLNGNEISSGKVVSNEGSYTLVATDTLGNTIKFAFTIDKTAPVITINPYILVPTNQDITITASTNEGTLNATSHTFTKNGSFTFSVTDEAGNVTNETVIITNIDKEAPTIRGVKNGEFYNTDRTISFNEGSAWLNGQSIQNGFLVSEEGLYTLVVVDDCANTAQVIFTIDKTAPVVVGLNDTLFVGKTPSIQFSEGTATLNGQAFVSGQVVDAAGDYILTIEDTVGNSRTYQFKVISALSVPGQFGSSDVQYNSLKLQWLPSPYATGYEIYRSTSLTGSYTKIASTTSTNYVDSGLALGGTYFYKIRAYFTNTYSTSFSVYSQVISTKTAVATPMNVSAVSVSYASLQVQWNAVTGASGYEVWRSTGTSTTYALVKTQTTVGFVNTALVTNTTYNYKIRAYRLVGTTKVYGAFSTVTSAKPIPSAPSITVVSAGTNSLKVSWPAVSGATGYELSYSLIENGTYTLLPLQTSTTATISGLIVDTTYFVKVRAYRLVGTLKVYSGYSTTASAKPIPLTPTLSGSSGGFDRVNLSWTAIAGAAGYELYRLDGDSYTLISDQLTLSYTDDELVTGATRSYKVVAYAVLNDVKVRSLDSTIINVTPIPALSESFNVSLVDYNLIALDWSDVLGASGYEISYASTATGAASVIADLNVSEYTRSGLTFNSTGYYRVRAYTTVNDAKVYGNWTTALAVKTALSAVPNPSATYTAYNAIQVGWSAVNGASGYEVWRSTGTSTTYTLIKTQTTVGFLNTALVTNTRYNYKIRAYRLVGTTKVYGAFSSVVSSTPLPWAPSPTATSAAYNALKISWPAVSGANGYEVSYATSEAGPFTVSSTLTTTSTTITGLLTNTPYTVRVRAYRIVNYKKVFGAYSSLVTGTPIPSTPTLKVVSGGFDSLNLSWAAIPGATGYEVQWLNPETSNYETLADTTGLSTVHSGLVSGVVQSYRISAYRLVGDTKVYSTASAVITGTPVPSTASGLKLSATNVSTLDFTWTPVLGASGYEVSRSTSLTGVYTTLGSTELTAYQLSGLAFNTTSYVKVRAYTLVNDVKVYGAWTTAVVGKTLPGTPVLTLSSPSYTSVQVDWAAVNGVSGYEIWRSTGTSTTYTLIKTQTTAGFLNTGLVFNTRYNYKVRAYKLVGTTKVYGAYSPIASQVTQVSAPSVLSESTPDSIALSWAAVNGASGYEVAIASTKDGPYTVSLQSTLTATFSALTPGSTYFIKVRAYRLVSTTKVYGPYTTILELTLPQLPE